MSNKNLSPATSTEVTQLGETIASVCSDFHTTERRQGALIRVLRTLRRLSQTDLASAVNADPKSSCRLSQYRVSIIEKGNGLYASELFPIARALKVDVSSFDL